MGKNQKDKKEGKQENKAADHPEPSLPTFSMKGETPSFGVKIPA